MSENELMTMLAEAINTERPCPVRLSQDQLDELRERSKRDDGIVVGSEVRQLVDEVERLRDPLGAVWLNPEAVARLFHHHYEQLAPSHGYETRKASAKPWAEVPEQNQKLMIATCAAALESLRPLLKGALR